MAIGTDERQDEILAAVRDLEPRDLMRLAALWAGVRDGTLDGDRQRRRNAARLALRYVTRREDRALTRARGSAAARAVESVMAGGRGRNGAVTDAAFAVTDALDAVAHAGKLTPAAHDELLRPWRDLLAELRGSGAR